MAFVYFYLVWPEFEYWFWVEIWDQRYSQVSWESNSSWVGIEGEKGPRTLKKFEFPQALQDEEPVSTAQLMASREGVIQKYKFKIGILASGLLENPEEKVTFNYLT